MYFRGLTRPNLTKSDLQTLKSTQEIIKDLLAQIKDELKQISELPKVRSGKPPPDMVSEQGTQA